MPAAYAIVIGASAGGVSALLELAAALPPSLDAVVGVVLHVGRQYSILPELLAQHSDWVAEHPRDGQALRRGTLYVAPPDHHMLLNAKSVQLSRGARENHARPALDPLFRSAALAWRERVIGVVLTGNLDDGTAGLASIKACGGIAVVQDPASAFEPSMPRSALSNVAVDHCLALGDIAPLLTRLVNGGRPGQAATPAPHVQREHAIFEGRQALSNLVVAGIQSALTCPECGGGLWEMSDRKPLRYRCHTGHAYSVRSLENATENAAEQALWSSVRVLRERELLLRRLASVAQDTGDTAQAEAGVRRADLLRDEIELLVRLSKGEAAADNQPTRTGAG